MEIETNEQKTFAWCPEIIVTHHKQWPNTTGEEYEKNLIYHLELSLICLLQREVKVLRGTILQLGGNGHGIIMVHYGHYGISDAAQKSWPFMETHISLEHLHQRLKTTTDRHVYYPVCDYTKCPTAIRSAPSPDKLQVYEQIINPNSHFCSCSFSTNTFHCLSAYTAEALRPEEPRLSWNQPAQNIFTFIFKQCPVNASCILIKTW